MAVRLHNSDRWIASDLASSMHQNARSCLDLLGMGHRRWIVTDMLSSYRIAPSVQAWPRDPRHPARSMVDHDTRRAWVPVRPVRLDTSGSAQRTAGRAPACCPAWPIPCRPVGPSDSPWAIPAAVEISSCLSSSSRLHLDCFWARWILFIILDLILDLLWIES